MPGTSKAKNPRGIEINFSEENHRYWSIIDGKNVNYTSCTTFVDKFFPKFDPDGSITSNYARKHGMTVEEVRRMWRENSNRSCTYGTKIHESMEDHVLGRSLRNRPSDDRERLVFDVAKNLSVRILTKGDVVGVEKIIFDENVKLAGTIDLLLKSKKNGRLWICDYKTNKEIDKVNKYGKFGFHPLESIIGSNYGHYTIQLNLYKYLMKLAGYVDDKEDIGMILFHISEKGLKSYVVDDHQDKVEKMVDMHMKGEIK